MIKVKYKIQILRHKILSIKYMSLLKIKILKIKKKILKYLNKDMRIQRDNKKSLKKTL